MRPLAIPPFRYMAWAKEQSLAAPAFHLGLSGLSPPPPSLLSPQTMLDTGIHGDLEQRGRHMPPVLADRMARRLGVDRSRMALTLGTSHAMYLLCATHLAPGDLCLVERPAYEMLTGLPGLFGARVERFDRGFERGWHPEGDLAATIRATRPAMVVMSNPHNPSGVLLTREELAPVATAAEEVGALLLIDEVYMEFMDEPVRHSAYGLSDCVATASSFTKAFGLGTVRLGWMCAAPASIAAALTYNDYISVLYPNPCAWVGLAALDALGAMKERARRIRETQLPIVERFVAARDDLRWHTPDAGVVGFVELPVADAAPFVERLRRDFDTLVVPGGFFEAPRFVRLGFGAERTVLERGLERLAAALDSLPESART